MRPARGGASALGARLPAGGDGHLRSAAGTRRRATPTLPGAGIKGWVARFGRLKTLALPQPIGALNDQLRRWRETLSSLGVQPSTGCADEPGEGPRRVAGRGRAGRLGPVHASGSAAAVARPRSHRGRAVAVDAGVQNRSTLKVDALDGDAAVAEGSPAARGPPPRGADAVRRRAARNRAGGWRRFRWSAKGWMRPGSSWRSAPTGSGPVPVRTERWSARPGRRVVLRSPCIRSGTPSRRGFAGRTRTWRTSRICTGTRIRRRR